MRKIAFVRVFSSHPILTSLDRMLKDSFPEYDLETITITELLKQHPGSLALNSPDVLRTYARDILKNPNFFGKRFLRTPYMFRRVRQLVRQHIEKNRSEYAFCFQFQSLFDTSTPGLPHFIYTDHTYRESQRYEYRNAPYSSAWADLEKEIYQNSDRIFTWSSNISQSLTNDYSIPQERVVCAYTGPNLTEDPGSGKLHDYSKRNILFVGSDWERKGGPALIEAFKIVLEALPDANLTIIGPIVSIGLPNCKILGRVPLEQLGIYLQQASVFCLPTRREPFGNVFVDAIKCGLPIVATDVGALPDIVINGENGYRVPPGDIHGIAQALIELLSDPNKCRRFGSCSHSLWRRRYNWDNVGAIMRREVLEVI